jgi:hypothetical protein
MAAGIDSVMHLHSLFPFVYVALLLFGNPKKPYLTRYLAAVYVALLLFV